MKRVHQNIILDGQDMGDAEIRKNSAFCNEGKWNNFIAPLLPQGDTFIEYGSNAGMYLNLASDKYKRVIGIERDKNDCKIAEKYREQNNKGYKIINADLNNFDLATLPLADVTLFANFHYHQHIDEFRRLLDKLETRTCYIIIVSVNDKKSPHWRAQADSDSVRKYLKHWRLFDAISENCYKFKNDTHPRRMFSMIFKSSKIEKIPLNEVNLMGTKEAKGYEYGREFVKEVLDGAEYQETKYYTQINKLRHHDWSQTKIDDFIKQKYNLVYDMSLQGQKEPLILDNKMRLVDGIHRFLILETINKDPFVRIM